MADNKKLQEELKKLEDQAYFELCQIIAEAMQVQDVDLLNARIASWKNKYKKLLDRPSTNSKSDFKKRIEYLLTQYYSEVTKYILGQLKLNEEKKIKNQAKALRELYTIIRDTNDYDLLKKKVDKWKEKYPVSGFLKMYQKRIELHTRDKNLRENAFKQEEAFSDLIDITKVHGTLDELKNELELWEEKYSINDTYSIDDFLKHQTEVKRYTSDEFLQSIARDEFNPNNIDNNKIDIVADYNNNTFSNLSIQANAYSTLLKISKSPNAVNEMFTWVYKNRDIKFNDKYKELILSATYLNYSPTYLNKISKPKIDLSKNSLSFDEYSSITDIKRYAIISYFNLLLPPEEAIANDYFNKHIQTIYSKSEKARLSVIKEDTTFPEEKPSFETKQTNLDSISNSPIVIDNNGNETVLEVAETKTVLSLESKDIENEVLQNSNAEKSKSGLDKLNIEPVEIIIESTQLNNKGETETVLDLSDINQGLTIDLNTTSLSLETTTSQNYTPHSVEENTSQLGSPLDYSYTDDLPLAHETIVAFSPLFFEAINNYNKQSVLINHIDSTVTRYIKQPKTKEISLDESIKTKIDEE